LTHLFHLPLLFHLENCQPYFYCWWSSCTETHPPRRGDGRRMLVFSREHSLSPRMLATSCDLIFIV
jgi:hypothetical protein